MNIRGTKQEWGASEGTKDETDHSISLRIATLEKELHATIERNQLELEATIERNQAENLRNQQNLDVKMNQILRLLQAPQSE